ncbi:MAG: pseudouridine synthase [Pirellulaceae bacterium]|nr:pseudouridine synthase [Pirellulaceae bacterium]
MPSRAPKNRQSKKPGKRSAPKKPKPDQPQRIQRLLAAAGFGSRRQCEELIEAGRVEVDGEIVSKLGTTANPATQKIRVDGVMLRPQKKVYYAVNKPTGVVTTNSDPRGRPRVIDLVPRTERVFPVGRLDLSSEGLILLTNDGDLAQHLSHPKYGVRKVYRVTVAGKVEPITMQKIREGIYIAEGFVKVEGAKILKARPRATELEIVLREGKNREIRRILARMGHKVQTLRRIANGPLRLGDVPAGAYRIVSREEVRKLEAAAQEIRADVEADKGRPKPSGAKSRKSAGKRSSGKQSGAKHSGGEKTAGNRTRRAATSSPRSSKKGSAASNRPGKKKEEFSISIPGFESETSQRAGSVIGGDAGEATERPKSAGRKRKSSGGKQGAGKRGAGKRSAGKRGAGKKGAGGARGSGTAKPSKRGTKKRTVKGKPKRGTKKSPARPAASSSGRGGSRSLKKSGAKKSTGKKRVTGKGATRKRKR